MIIINSLSSENMATHWGPAPDVDKIIHPVGNYTTFIIYYNYIRCTFLVYSHSIMYLLIIVDIETRFGESELYFVFPQ